MQELNQYELKLEELKDLKLSLEIEERLKQPEVKKKIHELNMS